MEFAERALQAMRMTATEDPRVIAEIEQAINDSRWRRRMWSLLESEAVYILADQDNRRAIYLVANDVFQMEDPNAVVEIDDESLEEVHGVWLAQGLEGLYRWAGRRLGVEPLTSALEAARLEDEKRKA